MRSMLCLLLSLMALPLCAEEVRVTGAEIKVTKEACALLTRHVPDADVAFTPGQGRKGRKVLPADVNASPVNTAVEDVFRIRLTNDAAKIFDLKMPEIQKGAETLPLAKPETEGFITLKNGVPVLGGVPLENEQQRQLAILCKKVEQ